MAARRSKRAANVQAAGVLITGASARNGDAAAVLLGGRLYTGREAYEFTDFGGSLDASDRGELHLAAFREFAEEYLGLSEEGCVPHGMRACRKCQESARSLARELWDAARDSIVGGGPVVRTGYYAAFVVPAEAVVPVLQRRGHLPHVAGASAIDTLFAAARENPELTSLALVGIDELLSEGVRSGSVRPIAVRNLDGAQRPSARVALRSCMLGRGGASLMALSSRLEESQRAAARALPRRTPDALPGPGDPRVPRGGGRLAIVFDMETGDPDDVLTLLFLAAHAAVELRAVTVTPGSRFQVSLIRWILREVGLPGVRVGAQDWPKNKDAPAPRGGFYASFEHLPTTDSDCEDAGQVLLECCDWSTTLLTGGPLTNLAAALSRGGFELGRWVAQGGFAGEGVVPPGRQMDKFRGKAFCRTTNFGSDPHAAHSALRSTSIGRKVCVSKNVCHQTLYSDGAGGWHAAVLSALQGTQGRPGRRRALELVHGAMGRYLQGGRGGKMIHDPLALAVALDESVCTLAEVELSSRGTKDDEWGSWPSQGSGTWISVDHDEAKFRAVLLRDGFVPQLSTPAAGGGSEEGGDEGGEEVAAGLSSTERECLKLARKLRDIRKLEDRGVRGAALQDGLRDKVNSKALVTTRFLDLLESLPSSSGVFVRVRDLTPAGQQGAAGNQAPQAVQAPSGRAESDAGCGHGAPGVQAGLAGAGEG
eukprot:CAMPEP_0179216354 /NCGR_PEP_ID=MMETSP0797-20121207/3334_1 /TAXON_ID=47934 /ORGANISM="Dinophysis acuminata, Strain DAEP01" /LENGTH=707 /DNA_ID=CAMNT_0020922507 /DNA_START=83 /DNA_END=2202 /DNA_ORIENTATION=+